MKRRTKRLIALLAALALALGGLTLAEGEAVEEQPAPAVEEQPAPAVEEQPAPAAEEQPAPAAEEQPAPVTEEQPAPVAEEQPAPASEEPAAPEVVDTTGGDGAVPADAESGGEQPADQAAVTTDGTEIVPDVVVDQTGDPAAEVVTEPVDPALDPSALPDAEQAAEEDQSGALSIILTNPAGLTRQGGAYSIDMALLTDSIAFVWSCSAACDAFDVSVSGPDGATLLSSRQTDSSAAISASGLVAGSYTVQVSALWAEEVVAQSRVTLNLVSGEPQEGGFPGGFPGGSFPGGGFGGKRGSMPSGTTGGEMVEQGFQVTPGKALTSSHSSGSKDMRLYGTVELAVDEAPMAELTLGGEALAIVLDSGASAFTASIDGAELSLSPADGGVEWTLNGAALRTLSKSGVEAVRLTLGGDSVLLPTEAEFTGSAYAKLRSEGYVASDCDYRVSASGVTLTVGGARYRVSDGGELIETEG